MYEEKGQQYFKRLLGNKKMAGKLNKYFVFGSRKDKQ